MPELAPFQTLIEAGLPFAYGQPLKEDDLTGPTSSTRIWVDDVNGDGKLDLLVGDSVYLIRPANGLTTEEFQEKFAAWQKAVQDASTAMLQNQPMKPHAPKPTRSIIRSTSNARSSCTKTGPASYGCTCRNDLMAVRRRRVWFMTCPLDAAIGVKRLAERHRQLNVTRAHYELWLDVLCESLAEHDCEFNSDLERMWRDSLQKGIELMAADPI